MATNHGKGAVIWQDALDSLPAATDPEADLGAAAPNADLSELLKELPLAAGGAQMGPVLVTTPAQDVEKLGVEAVEPLERGADDVGPVLEPVAVKVVVTSWQEELGPTDGAGLDVEAGLDTDEGTARSGTPLHEAVSPDTGSLSGSSLSAKSGFAQEALSWGKHEEYFRVSLSGEVFAGTACENRDLSCRATMDPQPSLESVGTEALGSACMSYT
jgi:hypothetical protein